MSHRAKAGHFWTYYFLKQVCRRPEKGQYLFVEKELSVDEIDFLAKLFVDQVNSIINEQEEPHQANLQYCPRII